MELPKWKIGNPWPYFIKIEQEIFSLSEVVHFSSHNENVYGDKFAKLIVIMGSEIDTNLRIMTGGEKKSNMRTWKKWLSKWNPEIKEMSIDNRFRFFFL